MEIVQFEPDMAADVARCYSDLVEPVPHCAPVEAEWFSSLDRLARDPCSEESLLLAREAGEIVGFVHAAVAAPPTEESHVKGRPGLIRFLSFRPGQRSIGGALLEAAEQWLRERKRPKVIAGLSTYMYPFYYLPWAHISERIAHLPPLFGMAGYKVDDSEVFFSWENFEEPDVPRPDLDFQVAAEWRAQVERFGPGLVVSARRGAELLGECQIVKVAPAGGRPGPEDWCMCTGLYIEEEELRGRGLGKYMLSFGLREAKRAGLRHAAISTEWDNWRAYLFYTNFGFSFLDRTFSFRKKLK